MRVRLFSLLILIGLVLACDSGGPTPPPPQIPQPARVQLKANDVLVFAGQRVALRDLVWRVTDQQGRDLTEYTLTAHLPAGWSIRNDTVQAPATETKVSLRVTATHLPTSTNRSAGPLFSSHTAPADTTDTATVTSGVDLKARQWEVSYFCATRARVALHDHRYVDSMRVENASIDSVVYATDSSWIPQFGGVAQIWYSGTVRRWLEDGSEVTATISPHQEILRQAPDTIVAGSATSNERHNMIRVAGSLQGAPLRYEGGTWCESHWTHTRGPVTFQQVVP